MAEGIERPEQIGPIVEAGCLEGQGFLFARPVDAETPTALLRVGPLGPAARRIRIPQPTAAARG